ncbi:MAG: hypothetical protein RL754_444 [Bacteroidota bacterium]|jgi:3'(2'), 5'-bisphosphate nucleotidase
MKTHDLDKYSLIAAQAALDGGRAILEVYNNEETKVELKGDQSPLTQADLKSHEAIMEHLLMTDIPVLSEEGKHLPFTERKDWTTLWIVDPLDGTKEFIKRNGEFTVNVALVQEQLPIIGAVYVPVTGELYLGVKGFGALKLIIAADQAITAEMLEGAVPLPVELDRPFTAVGSRSHMNDETKEFLQAFYKKHGKVDIISKGSSLKMCMVAEGLADVYPRFAPTMEWDTAAGQAVVEAAGFKMVDKENHERLKYNKEDLYNPHFIVM